VASPPHAYVELHARSAFSFLEGASLPEDLASRCAEFQQPAMAIADANGFYGSPRFHLAAGKLNIRALIGAEIDTEEGCRYTLLVESRQGYQNLCRLITRTKMRNGSIGKAESSYATEADFAEYSSGLICLTGGDEGPLAQIYRQANGPEAADRAQNKIATLTRLFGPKNVYLELQRHARRDQEFRNQAVIELAHNLHLPLLATNGVAHSTAGERPLLEILTCTRHKTTVEKAGRLLSFNGERHLKTSEQMWRLFADLPDAYGNTAEVADRLQFTLTDLGYQFPRYPVRPGEN